MLINDRESLVEKPRPLQVRKQSAFVALVSLALLLGVGGLGQYHFHT